MSHTLTAGASPACPPLLSMVRLTSMQNHTVHKQGYRFYLIIFYILVATLFTSAGICIWVGWCFKNDSFPFLWPIKVARIVVSLFVSMFYIASLNIFLIALQCKPELDAKGKRHWVHLIYHLGVISVGGGGLLTEGEARPSECKNNPLSSQRGHPTPPPPPTVSACRT